MGQIIVHFLNKKDFYWTILFISRSLLITGVRQAFYFILNVNKHVLLNEDHMFLIYLSVMVYYMAVVFISMIHTSYIHIVQGGR